MVVFKRPYDFIEKYKGRRVSLVCLDSIVYVGNLICFDANNNVIIDDVIINKEGKIKNNTEVFVKGSSVISIEPYVKE